jgi:hypothetical protein
MPKPFADHPGSGLHMHLSFSDRDGLAVMADRGNSHGLSETGRLCIAGLLAHSPALAVFHAPSVNSYKRLVVGHSLSGTTWEPARIAWADNNRTTLARVTGGASNSGSPMAVAIFTWHWLPPLRRCSTELICRCNRRSRLMRIFMNGRKGRIDSAADAWPGAGRTGS